MICEAWLGYRTSTAQLLEHLESLQNGPSRHLQDLYPTMLSRDLLRDRHVK